MPGKVAGMFVGLFGATEIMRAKESGGATLERPGRTAGGREGTSSGKSSGPRNLLLHSFHQRAVGTKNCSKGGGREDREGDRRERTGRLNTGIGREAEGEDSRLLKERKIWKIVS